GTEEGTVVHSVDGGVTWEEIELAPFLTESPAVEIGLNGGGFSPIGPFAGFNIKVGNFYYPLPVTGRRGSDQGPAQTPPPLPQLGLPPYFVFMPLAPSFPELVLATTGTHDPRPYEPIQHLKICPGSANNVFVTTGGKLHAAADNGAFVPVFYAR